MKQLLENLIKDWWTRPLPKIIPREFSLRDYADLKVKKIVSVVGFRRSGKTYSLLELAKSLGQRNCVYINFEDERIPKETAVLTNLLEVITELSGNKPYFLLLDEIQNIPDWSLWVRRVNETTAHRIFLTGSSSKLSSSNLPTELRGRSLTVSVSPLSFGEFLKFKGKDFSLLTQPQLLNLTREYLFYGGFPEIVLMEEGRKPLILDEYFQTFLTRDVIERHNLKEKEAMKTLIQLLLNCSFFTISKLANSLKSLGLTVGKATVARYLSFLEESFFLSSLYLHTPSLKNRLKAEKKPYFIDSYFLSRYSTAFSQNLGKIMENVVYNQLLKIVQNDPFYQIYYWKDYQNHEVDFVVRRKEKVENIIQVSFVSRRGEVNPREIRSLAVAAKVFKLKKALFITWDLEEEAKAPFGKIIFVPLYKWLVEGERWKLTLCENRQMS